MAERVYIDFDDEQVIQYIHYDDGQLENNMDTVYDDTCVLHCTDNDTEVTAEVMDFRPEHYLKCSIKRQIAIQLSYNAQHKVYIGSMGGLEFTTAGPKGREVKNTRHF